MTMAASTQLTTPVTNRDHIRGIDSAAVTVVEYGDYACPHCNERRCIHVDEQVAGDLLSIVPDLSLKALGS